jgi:hypothetical protein
MTEGPGAEGAPPTLTDKERAPGQDLFGLGEQDRRALLDWVGEHLPQVRQSVFGQRLLYWSLGIGFVVGQIIPEVKRRQFKQMLDAYEATLRDKDRAGSDQA